MTSLEIRRDHFKVTPPVPAGQVVVKDHSKSGWRLMTPVASGRPRGREDAGSRGPVADLRPPPPLTTMEVEQLCLDT